MKKSSVFELIKENWLLVIIFLVGIAIRTYEFGNIPPGINQDEVSAGYDAWSIYKYGIDRNGYRYPVIFKGLGAGQNSLHQYLSIPFIAIFGLNKYSIRAVDLVFGIITLIVFYLVVQDFFNKKTAIFATFLLAICPWHIMHSRWGLEENLFPVFFLIANLFLVRALKKQKYLPFSFLFFALSIYGHNSAYFVVPMFVVLASAYLILHKKVNQRIFFLSALIFCIVALPVLIYIIINTFNLSPVETPFLSIPKASVPRFKDSVIFNGRFSDIKHNFNAFIKLILKQNVSLKNIRPYGFIYPLGIPLALIGLFVIFKKQRIKSFEKTFFVMLWLLLAFILCLLAEASDHRVNIIFFPLIMLASAGALLIKDSIHPYLFYLMTILFLLFFASFAHVYFTEYPDKIDPIFFESFDEAIAYAIKSTKRQICITNQVEMPYIYVLFHEKTDPNKFRQTVEYYNPDEMWQWVKKYDRYYFGAESCKNATNIQAYIFHKSESKIFTTDKFDIKWFKNYGVALPLLNPQ